MSDGPAFPPSRRRRYPTSLLALAAVAVYWLSAAIMLPLSVPGAIISPVWPPAALALCICLRWGAALVPGIGAGAALAFLWHGWPPPPAIIIGAASALAAWSAARLVERLQRHGEDFMYNGNLFRFVLVALASGLLSAPLAAAGALLGDRLGPEPWLGWLTWTVGTASGTVIFTPLLRAWRNTAGITLTRAKKIEALAFAILLPAIAYIAFSGAGGAWSFAYLPVPFMIWAAYRFNVTAISWSTALVCVVAVWGTMRGVGPFAHADLNTALLTLVAYISVVGILGLTLSSLLHQRASAERKLKDERDHLEQRVLARTNALHAELDERKRIEKKLAEAQRLAQVGSWNLDLVTGEMVWSEQLYRITGLNPAQKPPPPDAYEAMTHPDDRQAVAKAIKNCLTVGEPFSLEHRIIQPGGRQRIVAAKGQGEHDANGRLVRVFGTLQDISEAREAETALLEAQERYRLVVEVSPDAILVQQDDEIVYVNPASYSLLGAAPGVRLTGRSMHSFFPPDWRTTCSKHLTAVEQGAGGGPVECKLLRLDGGEIDVEVSSSPFSHQGRFAILRFMRDITERKRSGDQLAYLAHYDSLTGLPNRTLFNQQLEHAMSVAARPGRTLELLFLDLDRFKQINDTQGHAAGDLVLKEAARRLRASLRESDTVARLAGDEFVVLIENVDEPQRGGTIAEKILAAFAPAFIAGIKIFHISTSIGIATYPDDGADTATLLKRADQAMYRAKQQGRNRYCYYSARLDAKTTERRSLELALRDAIERGEMMVYYQPRVDIASGRINGMEALLRWNHPALGQVPPQQFIPLAEEFGLMTVLGDWALRQACRQAREWQAHGLHVSVNLSPRQLADAGQASRIDAILRETGLPARLLEIEVAEAALSADPTLTLRALQALRELGVSLSIDRFGVGYASLIQLKDAHVGRLKIDRSLMRGIPFDDDDTAITRAIIGLAHNLGITVVAQGAETRQQVDFLREHACDSVQGHYFGEAMPAARVNEHLRAHHLH